MPRYFAILTLLALGLLGTACENGPSSSGSKTSSKAKPKYKIRDQKRGVDLRATVALDRDSALDKLETLIGAEGRITSNEREKGEISAEIAGSNVHVRVNKVSNEISRVIIRATKSTSGLSDEELAKRIIEELKE